MRFWQAPPAEEVPTSPLSNEALAPEARRLTDRYEFLRELGRGGMAVVYLAREVATGQVVAIKLLGDVRRLGPGAVRRFAREAETVAALEHPNIVRVLRVEELGGAPAAIVSVYIPGDTLRAELLRSGPLPFDRASQLLQEITSALAHAHARRIVHRDVKPENIVLEAHTGRALLADFGIARPLDAETTLTAVGSAVGTPTYMAPEQVAGVAVDERADVYAIGLVGWEMLAGRRPWAGETLYQVLHKQQHERLPALDELRPDIPTYLLRAIEGAIEKDPAHRWRDAADLLERLTPRPSALPPLPAGVEPQRHEATTDPALAAMPTAASPDVPVPTAESTEAPPAAAPSPLVPPERPHRDTERVEAPAPAEPVEPKRVASAAHPAFVAPPLAVRPVRGKGRTRRWPIAAALAVALLLVVGLYAMSRRSDSRPLSGDLALDSALTAANASGGVVVVDSADRASAERAAPEARPATPRPAAPRPAAPRQTAAAPRRTAPASNRVEAAGSVDLPRAAPRAPTDRCRSAASVDQRACLLAAIDRNDAGLNRAYQALITDVRRRGGARAVEALRVEQRAWLAARDRACRAATPEASNALWGAARVPCFADRSARRAAELRRRRTGA